MKTVWDKFWKKSGKDMEWNQEDILHSNGMKILSDHILSFLNKKNWEKISLLELGSGMGITSLFFGYMGADVTLLDMSKEVKPLAKKYWGNYSKHKFIVSDMFKFKPKMKYDVITSFGLCEHFIGNSRKEVLQKHIDLLKDYGVAVISVPYKYGIFYRITKKLAELTGLWSFGLEVPFSKKELIEFANTNKLEYKIIMSGFYSSAYDILIRKPLKVLRIQTKRKFDDKKSIFDKYLGGGMMIILKRI